MIHHFVAHTLIRQRPLQRREAARWLWRHLRHSFPRVAAVCLMPDHVHLIAYTTDPRLDRLRFAKVLGALSRIARSKPTWLTATPSKVGDAKHLARQIRYVHLNPSRAGLADDPLEWPWSTHRGVVGAEVSPWARADDLARALERPRAGFETWFHAYVSADPSVSPNGSAFPVAAPPS